MERRKGDVRTSQTCDQVIDLFSSVEPLDAIVPLPELMRPTRIGDVLGQEHLLGPTGAIGRMVATSRLRSMVLWGPPGTGKTTVAHLLAEACGMHLRSLHASTVNTAELRSAFVEAEMHRATGRRTCLVIDEIHRMSRPLQDQLLGPVENGLVTLIACTTEHVGYELVDALLSRIEILRLSPHDEETQERILQRVETRLGVRLPLTEEARIALIRAAGGDGRSVLRHAETVLATGATIPVETDDLAKILGIPIWRSDKDRDLHYDRASAMQKAVRSSDPDAALYWFAEMIEAGEDMDFVMRRMIILANEEIGLADPQALIHCMAACEAYAKLGPKAGVHVLAQAVAHMACSPKSKAVHTALDRARSLVRKTGDRDPNEISINHATNEIAKARGYIDDHTKPGAFGGQSHWPEGIGRTRLYEPTGRGMEAAISKRLDHWSSMRSRE
jgi:putative ATPase